MRYTMRKKKGISPMIAGVLLVALTVMVSIIVMNWVTDLTKTESQKVGNRTASGVDCTSTNINIDAVYLDFTGNRTRVHVRNAGLVNDSIVDAILLNSDGEMFANMTTFPQNINKGELVTIIFNSSGQPLGEPVLKTNITCDSFNRVRITTACTTDEWDSTPTNC